MGNQLHFLIVGALGLFFLNHCDSQKPSLSQSATTSVLAIGSPQSKQSFPLPDQVDFNIHIRPILSNTCFHCHGPDEAKQEADFAIHTLKDATQELKNSNGKFGIVPGHPEQSEVYRRIVDQDDPMPPSDSIHKLTKQQQAMIKKWIAQGAEYKKHWAFIAPSKISPEESIWAANPIDQFIAAKHRELSIQPSPPASKPTWLRRVTLSTTGLPPTVEEYENFMNDSDVSAKEKVVDRLLSSPAYGEHMAVAWMEAARFADTDGFQQDRERENWPWRDYVIKAFNENKSFSDFTIEQLAGDLLPSPTHEQLIATAFNRNHRQNAELGSIREEFMIENVLDRVDTVGSIYFGLTMSCARCHDHKYDPISQKEVFQFSSYFNNIDENPITAGLRAKPLKQSFSLLTPEHLKPLQQAHLKLLQELEHIEQQVNREWRSKDQSLRGSALNAKVANDPRIKKVKQRTNESLNKIQQSGYADLAKVMIMTESKGETPTYLLERGQYDQPDTSEKLSRTVPAAILGNHPAPTDRLELAQWIVSEHNPLTARVIVNRIWQHHFGQGIVVTSEDFGSQASFPSHPKLLDWLAVDFRQSNWDMKRLHKMILLSSTFAQQSIHTRESKIKDPSNKWLARGPRFRLSGYTIRDQALFSAGLLHPKLGGPSVKPYQPAGLWNSMVMDPKVFYKSSEGDNLYRRSLYTFWKRAVHPPRLSLFDGAGREVCSVTQKRTNTPLQALILMNDETFWEAARMLAQRSLLKSHLNSEEQIALVHQQAMGYPIDEESLSILMPAYNHFLSYYAGHPGQASDILQLGNSPTDSALDQSQHAALTAIAHIIMNSDTFVTQE